jgi:hypothetical protein
MPADRIPVPDAQQVERWTSDDGIRAALPTCRPQESAVEGRVGWAERARAAGMPEREAMNHLGHKSKAVHRAYAARAKVVTLPFEHYERRQMDKIIEFRANNDSRAPEKAAAS